MQFTWVDYPNQYEAELENWCDDTVLYAIDSESIKEEHDWYIHESSHTLNKDYFCKIVLDGEIVAALIMLVIRKNELKTCITENIVYIDTFIINPAVRQQGYGTKIIDELIQHAEKIIPFANNIIIAQIHKENDNSKKLFTKSGFHYIYTDAEENDEWFDWIYPPSAANRYISWRDE